MSAYAQEYGYFFNSISNDRTYNADSFEQWLKKFFLSGVFEGDLQVTAQSTPDMTVNVAAGYANLDGKPAKWGSSNTMTLATASGVYNRIDTIVLRRNDTNRTISIEVVTGTAALTPQPTAPTRSADVYELVLAQILVPVGATSISQANITDTRMDSDICGYVAATVDQIDFDQILAQYTAWAAETQEFFEDWFENIRGQLDEDAAGHLQNEIDDINGLIGSGTLYTDQQTLIGAINEVDDNQKHTDSAIAYREGGNTATHTIPKGSYVIWKNNMCEANQAISAGDTLSTLTNLTPVDHGVANALNSNLVSKSQIKNNLTTTTTGDVLDAKMGRELKLYLNALAVASLIYTFTGTGSTSVTLDYNAQNYAFTMALVLDSNNDVIGTAFVNPVIANNRDIKIYCGSTTCWGSFKLTNNGAKCTFNRTTANTASVLLYGVGSKSL